MKFVVDFLQVLIYIIALAESEVSIISPRTGRPPKDDARREQLTLRLKAETLKKLKECAERNGITRTAVIEQGIDMVDEATKK